MESFHSSLRHHPLIRYQSTGHFLRQNKSTLEPKKPSFKIFELFLLSKLVCTYDKQNIPKHFEQWKCGGRHIFTLD